MRRGRDVVLGESTSAETGVNQRPAPPTPRVTIGRRFTVFPERLTGIVLYSGLERKNSDGCTASAVPLHHKASHGRYVMTQVIALSLSIGVLGGIWAFLALGPLSGFVLVWP